MINHKKVNLLIPRQPHGLIHLLEAVLLLPVVSPDKLPLVASYSNLGISRHQTASHFLSQDPKLYPSSIITTKFSKKLKLMNRFDPRISIIQKIFGAIKTRSVFGAKGTKNARDA